jgi:hypothetical protein
MTPCIGAVEERLQSLNSALDEEMSFNPLHPREKNPLKLGFMYLKKFFYQSIDWYLPNTESTIRGVSGN